MTKAITLMVPKQRPSSESGMSGTLSSSRIWSWRQSDSSLLPMFSYLLSSTAFLSDLVEEGYRLPNVGFDVLGNSRLWPKISEASTHLTMNAKPFS